MKKQIMALIKCKECGQTISDKASACPHCGCPVSQIKICEECGEPLPEYATECPNCGCPTVASSNPSNRENTQEFMYSYDEDNGSSNKRKWLYGILALAVLALLAGLIFGPQSRRSNVPTEYCEELVKLAEDGNAEAQANLGICFAKGEGVSPSNEEAVKWFKKSSEQNNAKGQFYLSMAYNRGMGVSQDWEESIRLIQKSANQGFAKAQSQLGGIYEYGLMDIPKNHQEAMKWFKKAAEQGDPEGQYEVGSDCYFGENFNEAFKWFEKSAAQGKIEAIHSLGLCYYFGLGVEQDKMRGYNMVKQAVEQGDPTAINDLKKMELYGTN